MLTRVGQEAVDGLTTVTAAEAAFPAPFAAQLEYAAPARGTWNIVHTGMLLPESH